MQTMYINSTCVGNGCWKLKSVKAYCERKKVELKEAYCIVSTVDYAYTKTMNDIAAMAIGSIASETL